MTPLFIVLSPPQLVLFKILFCTRQRYVIVLLPRQICGADSNPNDPDGRSSRRRSRLGRKYQRRVVGNDRAVLEVPLVRVHMIGAPLEPSAGERAQISGQPPFARHEV